MIPFLVLNLILHYLKSCFQTEHLSLIKKVDRRSLKNIAEPVQKLLALQEINNSEKIK